MGGIKALRADSIICAGDVVGYCAYPNEVCKTIQQSVRVTVMGNHDRSALERDTSFMNRYAAKAVLWTADKLDEESRSFLTGLKPGASLESEGRTIALFHGSTESMTEYVFEEDVHEEMLSRAKADVLVLGHTHVPYVKRYATGLVINPGSVGQPRDGDWRASFALLDSDSMECEIARREYDIDGAAAGMDSAGLPSYLADRLYSGR